MSEILHILICDDDAAFLKIQHEAVSAIMRRRNEAAVINAFRGNKTIPEELLRHCDLAFLDIDFPQKTYNGIDIARQLRAVNRDAVIIFVTNYVEYAPEGYEVQAFRYLLKREVPKKLEEYLRLGIEQLHRARKTYAIQIGGETIHLLIEDILYIESQKHTATAYVRGNTVKSYSFYASLRSIEEALAQDGFLRIQKSYLVNMRHIQKYQCREAVLTGDIHLPVSEKTYSEQKRKYLLWKGRQ